MNTPAANVTKQLVVEETWKHSVIALCSNRLLSIFSPTCHQNRQQNGKHLRGDTAFYALW